MAVPNAAATVPLSDLGSYQHAVRLVLTHDVITATRPRAGTLEQVLRWADQMSADVRDLLGYTLIATTRQVRLSRRLDTLDPTQSAIFSSRSGRPFDRRRLAYLCLVLGSFQRSRVEISLADLVRAFTPAANAIDGLGFDPTVTAHKAAVVDVLDWLADRGALRLSDGSLESWAADAERGDALYDIDHDICAALFRPARPLQHLTSAAVLERLRTAFEGASSEIWAVVPEYNGRHGHPFLAGREMIEAFLKAPETASARDVEHQHQQHVEYVLVADPHVAMNVNTREDYAALLNSQTR